MSSFVLRQGLLVGAQGTHVGDLLVVDGVIRGVEAAMEAPAGAHEIDATNCWVGPGFVDLHTHLREPGREESETVMSGALAAAVGGYKPIVGMPKQQAAAANRGALS